VKIPKTCQKDKIVNETIFINIIAITTINKGYLVGIIIGHHVMGRIVIINYFGLYFHQKENISERHANDSHIPWSNAKTCHNQ
jgi:hypothetical protein